MVRAAGIASGIFAVVGAKTCPTTLFDETTPQRGDGTFYDDAGIGKYPNNGNCGFCKLPKVLNDRWRVALSYADYGPNRPQYGPHGRGGSAACGMCIKFRFPESTNSALPNTWSDAFVVDSCTGCKQGDIDFAVNAVSPPFDDRHPVEWYAEPCPVDDVKISYDFSSNSGASNTWYMRMGVRGMKVPLEQVEMCEFGDNHDECKPFYEETDGKWVLDSKALGEEFTSTSMKVRLTSIYGEQLDDTVGPISNTGGNLGHNCAAPSSTEEPINGNVQFQDTKGPGVLTNAGDKQSGNGIHGCGTVPSGGPHPGNPGATPPIPSNPTPDPTNPSDPTSPDSTPSPQPVAKEGSDGILIAALCGALLLCCCMIFYCHRRKSQNGASNEQQMHAVSGTRDCRTKYPSSTHRSGSSRSQKNLSKPPTKRSGSSRQAQRTRSSRNGRSSRV